MFDKLKVIERRYIHIEESLSRSDISGEELISLSKERSEIEPVVSAYRQYCEVQTNLKSSIELLSESDPELKELVQEEIKSLEEQKADIEYKLKVLLLPKDFRDSRNVLLEIRAGTGGDEAAIFCADLLRMYTRYAEMVGWRIEMMSSTESIKGGLKEVVLLISGKQVFSRLKFEMGVHRVQRVPVTESQGRVHTSACTVAVLPEAEEVDVNINPADLRIDTYRASGSGGQHVNRTDSAVRITHNPTGLVVQCQDERSQHKNKDRAMKMLSSRLLQQKQIDQDQERSENRQLQVGSGDRSERIRTYNFPQGRLTDHRINLTLYKLSEIIDGDLDELLDKLGNFYTAEELKVQQDSYGV